MSNVMKIVVNKFPCEPRLCIFGQYDAQYDVVECKIPCAQGYECTDTFKCPYLKVSEVSNYE